MAARNEVMVNKDENIFRVLKESLYPGATDDEVVMILNYCKARQLNPLLKPVHLVQMSVKSGRKDKDGKDIYERKNVIMPGIGQYRIDAARSGLYAGMSEPIFGDDVTEEFVSEKKRVKVTYPKWCKIVVKKVLPNGIIAEFPAVEFWKENFATKTKWDDTPNDMWSKRAYGQLAKCAEAQALRKAFPDIIGNEYTKEEMEGKLHFDENPKSKIIEGQINDEYHSLMADVHDFKLALENSQTEDQLKAVFTEIKKMNFGKHQDSLKELIDLKDKRKSDLQVKEFQKELDSSPVDLETGEVKS